MNVIEKKHFIFNKINIVIMIFNIIMFLFCLTGCNTTGLKNYDEYDVSWSFKQIENTGVGHDFLYQIKINGNNIWDEYPVIPAAKKLVCEITIIEDDKYDDISTKTVIIKNSYKQDDIDVTMRVDEYGGIDNYGTYAIFNVHLSFSGHKDFWEEEDYDNYDPYEGMK